MGRTCNRFWKIVCFAAIFFFFFLYILGGNFSLFYESHSRYLRFGSALLADVLT